MAKTSLKNKNIRKLIRLGRAGAGGSLGLTLPKEMVQALGWQEHQKVAAKRIRGGIVIRDWKRR